MAGRSQDEGSKRRRLLVRSCKIRNGRLVPGGEPEDLTLKEALGRLAPSNSHRARMNVMNVRPGHYIGVKQSPEGGAPVNFIVKNPTRDGDIRWLLQKAPEFEAELEEIFLVEGVEIPREVIDMPSVRGTPLRPMPVVVP